MWFIVVAVVLLKWMGSKGTETETWLFPHSTDLK